MAKNTICLWYDKDAEAAATFYAATFPDTKITGISRAPTDYPGGGKAGDALTVEFILMGVPCIGLNGGPHFKLSEAASISVMTGDQDETDRLWAALTADGGQESMCGWLKDRFGLSWQIVPADLPKYIAHPDPVAAGRAMKAMLQMKKLDIAALAAAVAAG